MVQALQGQIGRRPVSREKFENIGEASKARFTAKPSFYISFNIHKEFFPPEFLAVRRLLSCPRTPLCHIPPCKRDLVFAASNRRNNALRSLSRDCPTLPVDEVKQPSCSLNLFFVIASGSAGFPA